MKLFDKAVIFFSILFTGITCYASGAVTATVTLPEKKDAKNTYFTLTINNQSTETLENWSLHFQILRISAAFKNAQKKQQIGYYYQTSSDTPSEHTLQPGKSVTLKVYGKPGEGALTHITDLPRGIFLSAKGKNHIEVSVVNNIPPYLLKRNEARQNYILNQKLLSPPTKLLLADGAMRIVPRPASIQFFQEQQPFKMNADTKIIVNAGNLNPKAKHAATLFNQQIQGAIDFRLTIDTGKRGSTDRNYILLLNDPQIQAEGYSLTSNNESITIKASDYAGFFYALQSLRQLLPPNIYSHEQQKSITWTVPIVSIDDFPRYAYRGFMLDVARTYVPIRQIKRLVKLMASLKLNRLHLHLTDDEAWRLKLPSFPLLTKKGGWRGFPWKQSFLPPATGSGFKKTGGEYTPQQIKALIKFAKARNIIVIPEIDIPAHARALIKSKPDDFIEPGDISVYKTYQGYIDNVLPFNYHKTNKTLKRILSEVSQEFPGKYIHIGSDELPRGAWSQSPSAIKYAIEKVWVPKNTKSLRAYPNVTHKLHTAFANRMVQDIQAIGKITAGWQEVLSGGPLEDNSTLIYVWTTLTDTERKALENSSNPVVLTDSNYLYFDIAYSQDYKEPGLYWTKTPETTYKAYAFKPDDLYSSIKNHVKGVEAALWGDTLTGQKSYNKKQLQDRMDYQAFPKMLAASELAWTPKDKRNWRSFAKRVGQYALPRLDYFGVHYRLPIPGMQSVENGVQANIVFPGLVLRYTTDGSKPTANSPKYQIGTTIKGDIRMRSFGQKTGDKNERGGRMGFLNK